MGCQLKDDDCGLARGLCTSRGRTGATEEGQQFTRARCKAHFVQHHVRRTVAEALGKLVHDGALAYAAWSKETNVPQALAVQHRVQDPLLRVDARQRAAGRAGVALGAFCPVRGLKGANVLAGLQLKFVNETLNNLMRGCVGEGGLRERERNGNWVGWMQALCAARAWQDTPSPWPLAAPCSVLAT